MEQHTINRFHLVLEKLVSKMAGCGQKGLVVPEPHFNPQAHHQRAEGHFPRDGSFHRAARHPFRPIGIGPDNRSTIAIAERKTAKRFMRKPPCIYTDTLSDGTEHIATNTTNLSIARLQAYASSLAPFFAKTASRQD